MRTTSLLVIVAASLGLAALLTLRDAGGPTAEDRVIAMGLLMHTPVQSETVDEGLRIAEGLRRHFGIDSGDVHADRVTAAIRAWDEIVAPLEVTPEQLRAAAEELGYSLDRSRCGNRCENVARLARIELEKRALQRFASGEAS